MFECRRCVPTLPLQSQPRRCLHLPAVRLEGPQQWPPIQKPGDLCPIPPAAHPLDSRDLSLAAIAAGACGDCSSSCPTAASAALNTLEVTSLAMWAGSSSLRSSSACLRRTLSALSFLVEGESALKAGP